MESSLTYSCLSPLLFLFTFRRVLLQIQIHLLQIHGPLGRTLGDEDLDGLDHDDEVFDDAVVLDVHEVVDELVVGRGVVLGEDLREARDAGLDVVAVGVLGVLFRELLDKVRTLGARADKAHVAVEDVPDLRQLVEAGRADEGPDFRDARVVVRRELRARVFLGVDAHRAELVDLVGLAEAACADLAVERGAVVLELDGEGRRGHEGQREDKGKAREHDVDGALDGAVLDAQAQAARPKNRHIVDALELCAVTEDFVGTRDDVGLDFLVRAVLDDVGLDVNRDVGADDDDVRVLEVGFFFPLVVRAHDDLTELEANLRLRGHAVVDVAALLFIADNQSTARLVEILLVALRDAFPEGEQDEFDAGADDGEHARIGKLVDEEAQGHDHDEHEEEAHGEADEDFAEALVADRVEAVDGKHHDGQQDDDGQHAGVKRGMGFEGTAREDEHGAEAVGNDDDGDVAEKVQYFSRFWINAGFHEVNPFCLLIYHAYA